VGRGVTVGVRGVWVGRDVADGLGAGVPVAVESGLADSGLSSVGEVTVESEVAGAGIVGDTMV
jgi:hypothetical protein